MEAQKQFNDLSIFKGRDVELFRSSDLNQTALYFTELFAESSVDEREKAKAYFELLRFGLEGGAHQIYVRFPNTDHFIEMFDGGFGSGRGDMKKAEGENAWEEKHRVPFTIYSHNKDLILLMGRSDWTPEFNFMKKVASYDKGNPFNHPYPHETFVNYPEIEKALSMKYLMIPESIRNVQYCYKIDGVTPKYFLVDYPSYNFQYNNHRFFVIENELAKEYKIKNFQRFRDGGTTIITVVDENETEHTFYSPTSLPEKTLCEKWDDTELVEASKSEKQHLIELLAL